ncbi:LLM class flavin-dependent oxidoreductase [Streptomyces sp. SCSIO ZS0520]|uniref:LLM class flavin-dependent oxidoreductase n=1 Tax=Streptomyces sp. SCSIO ZS0520 TaxID=2892996 RepID=UPI0021D9E249|nr:LLM class flavin-dependent oxidoreductase [Streptomyces sp. SCSIO ZS0520]
MRVHGDAIRFGIHSGQQYATFSEMVDLWQRTEELGYDWISCFDHFRPPIGGPSGPCFEGTTLLSALAARTSRIRCALLVSAVTWRHPAVAAAAAATIDHVSGGRLEFGIGAAGDDLGYEQYGIPFPPAGERLDMLDEACRVLRGLWDEERTDFEGKHFRLSAAHLEPKPLQQRLPLVIGGEGVRRMLRIVAEHADIWNTLVAEPETYRRRLAALADHAASVGRDPGEIRQSMTFRAVLGEDRRQVEEQRRAVARILPPDSPLWSEYLVFGTPEECVERLKPYRELGVRDFLLGSRPPLDWRTIELFATEVIPALRDDTA